MKPTNTVLLGMDIGGSHATAALIEKQSGLLLSRSVQRVSVDAQGTSAAVVRDWTNLIERVLANAGMATTNLAGLAVAMPGPFAYETGVSKLTGVSKFDRLFGINLRVAFQQALPGVPISFINDAQAFGLGCAARYPNQPLVVLTLGTGLGSAFIRNGRLCLTEADGVPAGGYLYNLPYGEGMLEDYISTRYLVGRFRQLTGLEVANIAMLAASKEQRAVTSIFTEFGQRLGQALTPHLLRFGANQLVIGGGIAYAYNLFAPALIAQLPPNIVVHIEQLTEIINLAGAVQHASLYASQTSHSAKQSSL